MSLFILQERFINLFLDKYDKVKDEIFEEIYKFLGNEQFESKRTFMEKCKNLFSNIEKESINLIKSGLTLKLSKRYSELILTDNSTFSLIIEFIKKVTIK